MKKNKMATMAAIASIGTLSYMMYKKNPKMMDDMKKMMKNAAGKMLTKIENME